MIRTRDPHKEDREAFLIQSGIDVAVDFTHEVLFQRLRELRMLAELTLVPADAFSIVSFADAIEDEMRQLKIEVR